MKRWILLLFAVLFISCSVISFLPSETELPTPSLPTQTPEVPLNSPSPTASMTLEPTLMPTVVPTPKVVDKWDLWTNGTQLRGANIWQRLIVPRYDGNEFLGGAHTGPPYTQEDFNRLAALGANYVNLSHPGLFTERPPYVLDTEIQDSLDVMIAMAEKADLFVVITFRTGPGRNDFTFYRDDDWFDAQDLIEFVWSDLEAQAAWVEMWRYTAERYRDNPVVIGYDLMCEPNSNEILDEWDPDVFESLYGGSTYDWNAWYPQMVAAIREVDSQTPILVGSNGYSALDWLPYVDTIDDERIVYTFHQYAPFMYTHQAPGEVGFTYPGQFDMNFDGQEEVFNRDRLAGYLSIASDFADEHGVVLAINEFGAVRWGRDVPAFMQDEMALFEELGVNYALWVWDPAWSPWTEQVNAFNFRFGPDADNTVDVDNELQDVIVSYWSRNTVRPSNFYAQQPEP